MTIDLTDHPTHRRYLCRGAGHRNAPAAVFGGGPPLGPMGAHGLVVEGPDRARPPVRSRKLLLRQPRRPRSPPIPGPGGWITRPALIRDHCWDAPGIRGAEGIPPGRRLLAAMYGPAGPATRTRWWGAPWAPGMSGRCPLVTGGWAGGRPPPAPVESPRWVALARRRVHRQQHHRFHERQAQHISVATPGPVVTSRATTVRPFKLDPAHFPGATPFPLRAQRSCAPQPPYGVTGRMCWPRRATHPKRAYNLAAWAVGAGRAKIPVRSRRVSGRFPGNHLTSQVSRQTERRPDRQSSRHDGQHPRTPPFCPELCESRKPRVGPCHRL